MYLILILIMVVCSVWMWMWWVMKSNENDKSISESGVPISFIQDESSPQRVEHIEKSSTETSYITPPKIIDKLDLTIEQRKQFLKDYETYKSASYKKGDSSELIKNIIMQMTDDVDKEALYMVVMKYVRGKNVQKTSIPALLRMATCIVSNRKSISDPHKKNELDKRNDINQAIKDEFRYLRLSSLEAHILRNCILKFLNKTECVLSKESYKQVLKYLVRGYGVITNLQTIDNIHNNDYSSELKQYGFIEFNKDTQTWVPSIKAKLYTALRYDVAGDFIECPDNLAEIVCELEKGGYISFSADGIQLTDKCVDIKAVINLNDLYNDITSFMKTSNVDCVDYDLYTQNIFLDLKSFSKNLGGGGTLSRDDYNTMIVNISKAFTML